jgi:hypothetical protein
MSIETISLFGSSSKLLGSSAGKAFGRYSPTIISSPADIRKNVDNGFETEYPRITEHLKNKQAYDADFDELFASMNGAAIPRKVWRYSVLMKRAVKVLSKYLYKNQPKRMIPAAPEVAIYLEEIYRMEGVGSLVQAADRMTYITDVAAIEVYPNFSPDPMASPVKFRMWDASEVVPMFSQEDAKTPIAVATLTTYGNDQFIARVYTPKTVETYRIVEGKAELIESGVNYLNVIPFAFFHYEQPVNYFWSPGIGKALRDLNQHIVRRLTDLSDQIMNLRPKGFAKNCPPQWVMPTNMRPDEFITLPNAFNAQGEGPEAEIGWLYPDTNFTTIDWADLTQYIDLSLEMLGIPPSAIRMEQQGGTSGVAIQSEQLPLIEEAENRQVAFERYETELARITLIAAAAQMSMFKARPTIDPKLLMAVAANLSMTFRWPPMTKNRPGPDRDAHDAFLLQNQLASRVQIIMDNEGLTEEEAMLKVEMTLQQINQEELIVAQAQMQIQEQQMAMQAAYAPTPEPKASSNGKD